MKISKFIIITALSLPVFGFAQNATVPNLVSDSFSKEYQDVKPTWSSTNENFVAKFTVNNMKNELTYNSEGQKIESLVEISKERLQASNSEYIKLNYSKAKVQTVYIQNSAVAPERIVIDIIENGKTIRLYFRPDGTFFEEKR